MYRWRVLASVPCRLRAPASQACAQTGACSVNWRYSVDDGKTSLTAGKTGVAHTTIPDLTPGIVPLFSNQRVLASTVEGWSKPISLMVT